MTYSEMLRDPRWQKKRLEVLEAASFTCRECSATEKELQVHHRSYRRNAKPWEYEAGELLALCCDCHAKRTELDKELKTALGALDYVQAERVLRFAVGLLQPMDPVAAQRRLAIRSELSTVKAHEIATRLLREYMTLT